MARQCRTTEQRKNPHGYCADGSALADKNACWGQSPEQIPLSPSEARAAGAKQRSRRATCLPKRAPRVRCEARARRFRRDRRERRKALRADKPPIGEERSACRVGFNSASVGARRSGYLNIRGCVVFGVDRPGCTCPRPFGLRRAMEQAESSNPTSGRVRKRADHQPGQHRKRSLEGACRGLMPERACPRPFGLRRATEQAESSNPTSGRVRKRADLFRH